MILTMRRAWLLVLLGGCMKIYPDPELPDADVEWYSGDCEVANGDVSITLTGIDDPTEHHETSAPCNAVMTTLADLSRQRFHVAGMLHDEAGGPFAEAETDIDLRNGFDQTAYLYFDARNDVRVRWSFAMGATCGSLQVDGVSVVLSVDGVSYGDFGGPCDTILVAGSVPYGTYRVEAYAYRSTGQIVATLVDPIVDLMIQPGMRADLDILLTPCGSSCPQP